MLWKARCAKSLIAELRHAPYPRPASGRIAVKGIHTSYLGVETVKVFRV